MASQAGANAPPDVRWLCWLYCTRTIFPAAHRVFKDPIAKTVLQCPSSLPFFIMSRPRNAIVDRPSIRYESIQVGVYRLTLGEKRGPNFFLPGKEQVARVQDFASMLPFARRFLVEICNLGRRPLAAIWVIELLQSVEPGVSLYLSNWLLRTVSSGCYVPSETKFGLTKLD